MPERAISKSAGVGRKERSTRRWGSGCSSGAVSTSGKSRLSGFKERGGRKSLVSKRGEYGLREHSFIREEKRTRNSAAREWRTPYFIKSEGFSFYGGREDLLSPLRERDSLHRRYEEI